LLEIEFVTVVNKTVQFVKNQNSGNFTK